MIRVVFALALVAATAAAYAAAPDAEAPVPCNTDLVTASASLKRVAACDALIAGGTLKGPDLANAYRDRADGYFILEKFEQALADYDRAIPRYGKAEPPSQDLLTALSRKGDALVALDRVAPAIGLYDRVLAANPEMIETIYGRGHAWFQLGFLKRAREDFARGVELYPDDAQTLSARGSTSLAVGDFPAALEDLDRALEIAPDFGWAYVNRGNVYVAQGRYERAMDDFDRALVIDPNDKRALEAVKAVRALQLAQQGRIAAGPPADPTAAPPRSAPSRAVGRTHDCTSLYPDFSRWLFEGGDVQVHYDVDAAGGIVNVGVTRSSGSPRLDRAAVDCVSALWRSTAAIQDGVAVPSRNHQAIIRFTIATFVLPADYDHRAHALAAIGEYDQAFAALDEADRLGPQYAESRYTRGWIHYILGQPKLALADFAQALAIRKAYPAAAEAREMIRQEMAREPKKPAKAPEHAI